MISDPFPWDLRAGAATVGRYLLATFTSTMFLCGGEALPTELDATRLGPERTAVLAQVIERMRLRLWTVEVIADDGIPTGWHAFSGGIHLRAMSIIPPASECWVLPGEWIGIQEPVPEGRSYELIRRSDVVIALRAPDSQGRLQGLLTELFPGPLENESHEQTAAQRTPEQAAASDRVAQDLIARFCPDGPNVRAAIDSLSELRIPAATVFADGVRSTDAAVVDSAIRALGELGGAHATTLLLPELLRAEDTRTAIWRKRNAAQALLQIADSTCGPALLAALPQVQDVETKMDVVEALERIEYQSAGDAVLALFAQATTQRQQAHYAKALASLRHAAAIPLLRQKYGDAPLTGTSLFKLREPSVMGGGVLGGVLDRRPEIALLRLTAPWGEPVDGIRLLLVPLDHTDVGRNCRIALVIENHSAKERHAVGYLANGVLIIDGVRHSAAPGGFEGAFSIGQHGVWLDDCGLKPFITTPGTYRIQFSTGNATSNEVLVEVSAAPLRGK